MDFIIALCGEFLNRKLDIFSQAKGKTIHYYRLYFEIEYLTRKGFMNIIMFVIFAAHDLTSTLRSAQDE